MQTLVLVAPLVAAVAAIATGTLYGAMTVFFAYLTFEGFFKLLGDYHPVVHIGVDIVLWSIVGIAAMKAVLSGRVRLPALPFLTLIVLHAVWVSLLVFSPYTASIFVGVASLKIHLAMIPLYFMGYFITTDAGTPSRFFRYLTIIWVFTFFITLLQYALGPRSIVDFSGPALARFEYFHEWRPFGTTALPGGQAAFAFLALPVSLALVLRGDYRVRDVVIALALMGSAAVFFVSGVRQLFLGSLLIVFLMMALQIMRGRGRVVGTLVTVAALGGATYVGIQEFLLPQAQRSLESATGIPDIWRERNPLDRIPTLFESETYAKARAGGVTLIWDRATSVPFGAGLGRTGSAAATFGAGLGSDRFNRMLQDRFGFQDNFFAAMLVETGIPGTLFMTLIMFGLAFKAIRLARRAPTLQDSVLGSLVAGYIGAIIIMSWGSQPLMGNPTLAFFWFLAGMAIRRLHDVEAAAAPVPATADS